MPDAQVRVSQDHKPSKILTQQVRYRPAKRKEEGAGCFFFLFRDCSLQLQWYNGYRRDKHYSEDSHVYKTNPLYTAVCSKFHWWAVEFFHVIDKCTCFTFKSLLCHFNCLVFGPSLQPFQIFEKNVKVLIRDLKKYKLRCKLNFYNIMTYDGAYSHPQVWLSHGKTSMRHAGLTVQVSKLASGWSGLCSSTGWGYCTVFLDIWLS